MTSGSYQPLMPGGESTSAQLRRVRQERDEARAATVADDVPRCTLGPPTAAATCYCTNRPGCPHDGGDDVCACGDVACPGDCEEPDDDPGYGDGRPIETVDTGGLL